jgi:hypothetical protein
MVSSAVTATKLNNTRGQLGKEKDLILSSYETGVCTIKKA